MEEIIDYIWDGKLPEDCSLARKLIQKASRYTVIHEKLYWRSYSRSHSLSITSEVNLKIMNDIHSGVYESNNRRLLLAYKTIRCN